jgi:hypothetical protein
MNFRKMGEIEKQNYFNNETKKIKRVRIKLKKKNIS